MTVRIGFLGAGYVAGRHAESLARLPDVTLAAVADPRPDRREAFAARTDATPHPDADAMLAREGLDAVYVCLPPFAHGAPEEALIAAGLPFFVEKPLSTRLEVAERIAAAVARAGLVTATGYHWRYLDTVEEAAGLLTAAPPALVLGSWLDRTPGTDWWIDEEGSGGQLVDQVTHLFDLARLLVGDLEVVHGLGTRLAGRPGGTIPHATTCTVRFASGAIGAFAATCLLRRGHRIGMELFCDGVTVGLTERELTVDDGTTRRVVTSRVEPFAREDADFVAAVRGEENRIRAPYAEALESHRLALAAAGAARASAVGVERG